MLNIMSLDCEERFLKRFASHPNEVGYEYNDVEKELGQRANQKRCNDIEKQRESENKADNECNKEQMHKSCYNIGQPKEGNKACSKEQKDKRCNIINDITELPKHDDKTCSREQLCNSIEEMAQLQSCNSIEELIMKVSISGVEKTNEIFNSKKHKRARQRMSRFIDALNDTTRILHNWSKDYQQQHLDIDDMTTLYESGLTFGFLNIPAHIQHSQNIQHPTNLLYIRELFYAYLAILSTPGRGLGNLRATINYALSDIEDIIALIMRPRDINSFNWSIQSPLGKFQNVKTVFFSAFDVDNYPKPSDANITQDILKKHIVNLALLQQLIITMTKMSYITTKIMDNIFPN